MKLSLLLQPENILMPMELHGASKREIISAMLEILYKNTPLKEEKLSKDELIELLSARESELSTAVGGAFAFPHARIKNLKGFYMLFGISREGVDFDAPDGKLVNFFVMSLVSYSNPNLLLKTRAALMHFMRLDSMQKKVLDASDAKSVWNLVDASDVEILDDIIARDIMLAPRGYISSDMSLREAAVELHRHHIDSLPLIDRNGIFKGDLSCYDIFAYGMPGFFSTLKTISFVKHMNPFERYFDSDDTFKAGDLKIERELPVIGPDATLMEIIFDMTAKNRNILYVVENGKLLGVLDRFSVVDKILLRT